MVKIKEKTLEVVEGWRLFLPDVLLPLLSPQHFFSPLDWSTKLLRFYLRGNALIFLIYTDDHYHKYLVFREEIFSAYLKVKDD